MFLRHTNTWQRDTFESGGCALNVLRGRDCNPGFQPAEALLRCTTAACAGRAACFGCVHEVRIARFLHGDSVLVACRKDV